MTIQTCFYSQTGWLFRIVRMINLSKIWAAATKPIEMESNDNQNSGKEKIVLNHHRFCQMISRHAIGRRNLLIEARSTIAHNSVKGD